ncbi:MAG TPA: type II toxin-antitoxin system VapC family toxin [Terriglobia bacterium]|nr:type II toxin-antitoxin system VapC family toxin [Terriglobia bacterium]
MLRGRSRQLDGWALERLRQGDRMVVPAHWPTEILNGLLVAARRKRIRPDQPEQFWGELVRLPVETEPPLAAVQATTVLQFAEKHGLTVYDAVYLELVHRRQLPLGTLDTDLRKAAQLEGVPLL